VATKVLRLLPRTTHIKSVIGSSRSPRTPINLAKRNAGQKGVGKYFKIEDNK